MKKFATSVAFITVFSAYALYQHFGGSIDYSAQTASASVSATHTSSATQAALAASVQPTPVQIQRAPDPAKNPTPTLAPVTKPKGQYVDGTYTGSVADAYYGNVQVRAVISGGKIADVQFIQYPNDRSTSRRINVQAMPQLKSEAINTQSASVDGVSGASDTSVAFQQSLASALSKARA